MKKAKSHVKIVAFLAIALLLGFFPSPVAAKKSKKKLPPLEKLLERLLERAETYAKCYEKRKFKEIYDLINSKYRMRVSRVIYEDFITFPGETDKYFLVTIEMYDVLGDMALGKVIFNISTYAKGSSGSKDSDVLEREFLEATDWMYENGDWYKIERYDK